MSLAATIRPRRPSPQPDMTMREEARNIDGESEKPVQAKYPPIRFPNLWSYVSPSDPSLPCVIPNEIPRATRPRANHYTKAVLERTLEQPHNLPSGWISAQRSPEVNCIIDRAGVPCLFDTVYARRSIASTSQTMLLRDSSNSESGLVLLVAEFDRILARRPELMPALDIPQSVGSVASLNAIINPLQDYRWHWRWNGMSCKLLVQRGSLSRSKSAQIVYLVFFVDRKEFGRHSLKYTLTLCLDEPQRNGNDANVRTIDFAFSHWKLPAFYSAALNNTSEICALLKSPQGVLRDLNGVGNLFLPTSVS